MGVSEAARPAAYLWLVRHGQTDWNLEGRYQGQTDVPLNASGWEQARALTAQLEGRQIAAVFSSDLRRARDTAGVVAERLGLPVRVDVRLREIRLGEWEGMMFADIQARYPAEWQARQADPLNARPPGGESVVEVAARASAAADDVARAFPAQEVAVVAHGLSLAVLRVRALGLPLGAAYEHVPENGRPERVEWRVP
jgi:probable phosphoglycerate mutase